MTVSEYESQVKALAAANPTWPLGLAYFKVLEEVDPPFADRVRSTALDPTGGPAAIPLLLEQLGAHWA